MDQSRRRGSKSMSLVAARSSNVARISTSRRVTTVTPPSPSIALGPSRSGDHFSPTIEILAVHRAIRVVDAAYRDRYSALTRTPRNGTGAKARHAHACPRAREVRTHAA